MSNRYAILALSFWSAIGLVNAQQGYTRTHYRMLDEAKALLDGGQWSEASKIYKRLLIVDTAFADVYMEIAQCEVHLPGMRDAAADHFAAAARHGNIDAMYHLALERHRQQRFDETVSLLNDYRTKTNRTILDAEVDRRIGMARTAKSLTANPVDVKIRNMGAQVNSSAHDYSPVVTADGNTMYFTSRRTGTVGGQRDASGQYYEDIYAVQREEGIWGRASNVGAPLNTNMMDATVGLSVDGNEMVVYRTPPEAVSGNLYLSKRAQGRWSEPEALTERINSGSHEPSATISPDGSEIYFTSDRPGGLGGRDLYRIRRLPNGQWSLPLNLGPTVNTPYDEDAPFLHSDGSTLFFSSNGHNTMGGYDIFKSNLIDTDMNVWGLPENLGYPLNTVNDDIYFCLNEDGTTGHFSSERSNGLGGQDIYQVEFPDSQIDYLLVRGVVTDGSDEPVK
ncbi:MAG TPA: hypothetical protein VGE21_08895, partial [Flavobacteriales bacterium]